MFTERLIKISDEYFIRGGIIQTLMGFDGVVEVNETDKLNTAVRGVFKGNLTVPHFHEGADDALGFAVSLRAIDAGKLLTDAVLRTYFDESVIGSPFKFLAIIGVGIVDLIRALGDDGFSEEMCGAVLSFVRKNPGI